MNKSSYIPAWDKFLVWQGGKPVLATRQELEDCCCATDCHHYTLLCVTYSIAGVWARVSIFPGEGTPCILGGLSCTGAVVSLAFVDGGWVLTIDGVSSNANAGWSALRTYDFTLGGITGAVVHSGCCKGFPGFADGRNRYQELTLRDWDCCILPGGGEGILDGQPDAWRVDGHITWRANNDCKTATITEATGSYAGIIGQVWDLCSVWNQCGGAIVNDTKRNSTIVNGGDPPDGCCNPTGDKIYCILTGLIGAL